MVRICLSLAAKSTVLDFWVWGRPQILQVEPSLDSRISLPGAKLTLVVATFFSIRVFDNGEVNLFGSQFFLNGVELDLIPGQEFVITDRNVNLSGFLSDGSFIETDLNINFGGFFSSNPDGAGADSTVTSVVPEPSSTAIVLTGGVFLAARRRKSLTTAA